MELKVVLVQPLYAENIGLAARAMANFGFSKLVLVNPRAEHLNDAALSRAMHAKYILEKAEICGSLEAALQGCDYSIATTAKTTKPGRLRRTAISAAEFAQRFAESNARIAIVFGPEADGLSNTEIEKCDFIASIPCSKKYPTLNLSHAVALVLYELQKASATTEKVRGQFNTASGVVKNRALKKFDSLLEMLPEIENRAAVMRSFRALLGRALVSEKEALALLAFLSCAEKELIRKKPGK